MKGFQVSKHNLPDLFEEIQNELEEADLLIVDTKNANIGKWGMAKLWRSWMGKTGEFMAGNGCVMPLMLKEDGSHYGSRPFNANDAHELFTARWLGVDADGTRLSWSKAGRDGMRPATRGERFDALRNHEHWACDKGIILFKPRDSEYTELEREQNGQ